MNKLREEWSESIFISGGLYENLRFYEFRKKKVPLPIMQNQEEEKKDPAERPHNQAQ